MKLKKTIAISILTFGLSILFFNNIHSYDWPWEYIKSTVISGGTLSSSEGNSVEHGVITEHGYQDLYEQGITDEEIASWYSEAVALNNGGDKPSTHSTADSSSSDINNNDTTSADDKTVNDSSQNSSNSSSKVTYTDEEIDGDFVLEYVPLDEVEKILVDNAKKYGDKKGISNEMIEILKIYKEDN